MRLFRQAAWFCFGKIPPRFVFLRLAGSVSLVFFKNVTIRKDARLLCRRTPMGHGNTPKQSPLRNSSERIMRTALFPQGAQMRGEVFDATMLIADPYSRAVAERKTPFATSRDR